jgi:hypothetical protein
MRKKEKHIKNMIDYMAILIAIIALIVSIRSCQTSNDSFGLSEIDFHSERTIVLEADFSDQENIIFKPVDEEMKIVRLTVFEPDSIMRNGVEFNQIIDFESSPPGHWKYFDTFKELISKHHLKESCEGQPGNIMIITRIPIMISTRYIAKNTSLNDLSIYNLKYVFYREGTLDSLTESTYVLFENIELITHIEPERGEDIIKGLWDKKPFRVTFFENDSINKN